MSFKRPLALAFTVLGAPITLMAAETTNVAPQSIEITAQRITVQNLADRKVYKITEDVESVAGSAADVLDKIPSVEVDADGLVALRGDSKVTILIDGKPSAQFSGSNAGLALQQFPAAEIEKIEVMTSPPPQYKVDGSGGVINIITKKSHVDGFSGNAQLSAGPRERAVAGSTVSYGSGGLTLSSTVSLRQDYKQRIVTTDRAAIDPSTNDLVLSHESLHENLRRLTPQVKANLDYKFNDRETLDLAVSHRELTGARSFNQYDNSAAPNGPITVMTDRYSDGHEWNMAGSQSARFEQKLWRPDESLTLNFQRSVTRERERYSYIDFNLIPVAPPGFDHLHLDMDLITTDVSADYAVPLGADQTLKAGYDYQENDNAFDYYGDNVDPISGGLINNPAITNHFRYYQHVHAGYGSYQMVSGPWTLQTGARFEQTEIFTNQILGAITNRQSYSRFYPSLHLDYDLTEQDRLFLGLSRRINRPDPEDLNPLIDTQDVHNLRAGNATLLPQDTKAIEVGYGYDGKKLSYGVTAYGRFNHDSVTTVTQVLSADVVLVTKANLPSSRSGGLEVTANGTLFAGLSYNISANLFYNEIDATALGATGIQSTTGINSKSSLDYRPTENDTGQISFSRSDKRLTPQGMIGAINVVNLGYRRQLQPDLSVVATLSDLFNGQRLTRTVSIPTLQDHYQRLQVGQIVYIGVVYNFGAGKKGKGDGFDYDK